MFQYPQNLLAHLGLHHAHFFASFFDSDQIWSLWYLTWPDYPPNDMLNDACCHANEWCTACWEALLILCFLCGIALQP